MKIIFLYLSFVTFYVSSQNVEFNLKKECIKENTYGLISGRTPYLVIEIRNLKETGIYFKNPFLSIKEEIPEFVSSVIHSTYIEDKKIIKNLIGSRKEKSFFVKIGNPTNFYDLQEVQNEEVYKSKDTIYEVSYINNELSFIYRSIKLQKILDKKKINKKLSLFSNNDKDYISLNKVKNKLSYNEFYGSNNKLNLKVENSINIQLNKKTFFFLKKGETIRFRINLIGFKLLGGIYNFNLGFDNFEKFINYNNKRVILPLRYKNFSLYTGKVESNDITLSF